MRTLVVLVIVLVIVIGAPGCNDARPRVRFVAGPATAAATSSAVAQPPVSTPATPTSGSTAPQPSSTAPVATAGPGGLSAAPTTPLPPATRTLVVGPGPILATTARGPVHQHLRDWEPRDLIALDPRDARLAGDGLRDSRELVAFYARREGGKLFLRVDLLDLAYGAELGGLDLLFLLGWQSGQGATDLPLGLRETTAHPWDAALVVKDTADWSLLDRTRTSVLASPATGFELAYRSDLDGVELALEEAQLVRLGYAGQPLRFQVLAIKDGEVRADDAVLEEDLLDRSLDQVCREGWVAPRKAVVSVVAVANRAGLPAAMLNDLIWSRRLLTREGFPTGLRRTLDSHAAAGLPLDVHLNGVLGAAIGWASAQDPLQDGRAFLGDVAGLWDGNPANGEGAFLPGSFADALLPAVEGPAHAAFVARAAEWAREQLNVQAPGPVFWTPERVIGGSGLDHVRGLGFTHTALDRIHFETWFGARPTDGKLHRVNGVACFLIEPAWSLFAQQDGGPSRGLRELLLERALDPDAEQTVLLVADWEEFAGHKGDNDVPDRYEQNLLWLAQRPWIEVAGLATLAARGWTPVDHGTQPSLAVETNEWMRHACEERYEHWYYGHPLEESFAALRPPVAPGVPHPRAMGDLVTPGTILGDAWARVQAAPAGPLRSLAESTLASALYRTAWHQEDMHDLTRLANGAYLAPDQTRDGMTGFALALSARAGDAAVVAAGAAWAAAPPAQPRVRTADIDLDGEDEWLLEDERLLVVVERRGGRIAAAFARDPASGHAAMVAGAPLTYPSAVPMVDHEDASVGAARSSLLRDVWLTGPGRDYVNDEGVARVSTSGVAIEHVSSDGRVEKRIAWRAPGEVEVTYRLEPAAGRLYVRFGLAPDVAALALSGQRDLTEQDDGRVYRLTKRHGGRSVELRLGYADAGHAARRNAAANDGTPASPRNAALQHMVELEGDAPGFGFTIGATVR